MVPLDKSVADLNLEQVGRTDDTDGPQVGTASITGFDYSSLGSLFQETGRRVGIKVYKHERNSDRFFRASDNYALAELGVPAHSLCVAFVYPDYHKVSDHWEKIDFDNMARVNRMIALGLSRIANDQDVPRWSTSIPGAARFAEAAQKLHHPAGSPPSGK